MMFLDEIGTIPKIESAEMMFAASRSCRVSIVAIIIDNCQDIVFGGFAPNSESADILSKALGKSDCLVDYSRVHREL